MSDNPFKAPVETPMTFRDTCAVAAMQAIVIADDTCIYTDAAAMQEVAHCAYAMADAMLEARDARRVGR